MATTKTQTRKKPASNKKSGTKTGRRWSADVTRHSNALDLDKGVFTQGSPEKVAKSLERSAAKSTRKKSSGFQSAMSMLNFYINRAGKNLSTGKKKILEKAKEILRADHEKQDKK